MPEDLANCRTLSQQGVTSMQTGQWDQAEQLFGQAVSACGDDLNARRLYSEALWRRGATDQALAQLEIALKQHPADKDLAVRAGEMYLMLGKKLRAGQLAEQALHLDSRSAPAWALRSRVMLADGDEPQALADLHRALSYSPESPDLLLELAELYRRRDQPQRALSTLLRVADLYPPGEEPQHVLYLSGLAYTELQRYDQAVETLYSASRRGPLSAELLYRLGTAQRLAGKPLAALESARQAQQLDPTHTASRDLISHLEVVVRQQTAAPQRY